MDNRRKNALYSLFLLVAILAVYFYRQGNQAPDTSTSMVPVTLQGTTMGKIGYNVTFLAKADTAEILQASLQQETDHLLEAFNQSLSTYIGNSEISQFNQGTDTLYYQSSYMLPVLEASRAVYDASGGAYDPTVGPLVNAWGFGWESRPFPDSARIDSLLGLVGFGQVTFSEAAVWKNDSRVTLDFSAAAKGYAVDVVSDMLAQRGLQHHLVEIGGEVVARGRNASGAPWRLGVEDPTKPMAERSVGTVVSLENKGMATSGNYRNFYVKEGKKYAHTISPATGYPVEHNLLSATVVAQDCMTADAWATAFMVLGLQESIALLEENKNLEALLYYSDATGTLMTYQTTGMAGMILP